MNLYDQQKRNLRRTAGILAGFIVFVTLLGMGADMFLYGSGASPGLPVVTIGALLLGSGSPLWSPPGGDRAVLASTQAQPLGLPQPRQKSLANVVEEMAIAAGIPKPAV